jgi:pre-mRNA-splicing factor SYF1
MDLYERALKYIPNCYKLWFNYLKEQMEDLGGRSTFLSTRFEEMIDHFEKALIYMHKMPNIWLMFASYSASLKKFTLTRNIYDRAL